MLEMLTRIRFFEFLKKQKPKNEELFSLAQGYKKSFKNASKI